MATDGPVPTRSGDQAKSDLAEHGVAILEGALSADENAEVRGRLVAAAERARHEGWATRGYTIDPDENNERVFMLFNLDPIFADLIVRPVALQFVEAALEGPFIISNFSANILGPGAGSMNLHADQGFALEPWQEKPLAVNVGWLLDDFSEEVGATQYVPGSHRFGHNPEPGRTYETVSLVAPAGSLLAMDARLYHQSGVNRTTSRYRAALFGYYVRPWIRPQVNWNAALDPAVATTLDREFLDLLGYRAGLIDLDIFAPENARKLFA
jgi:ectoine hydroxylase-related dioxygenase (phytanoyl-CoA dioxygenase family)